MTPELGNALLSIARNAIENALEPASAPAPRFDDPRLVQELTHSGAVFVTLTIDGSLRGCIGSLSAHRPLAEDCSHNAVAAALEDPRFPPLWKKELDRIKIEVSRLSPARKFPCTSESDACARLIPGRHGVILSWHGHRATFLPQVWEQLPDPHSFLVELRKKAGLPGDFWAPDLELEVYEVEHVEESRN